MTVCVMKRPPNLRHTAGWVALLLGGTALSFGFAYQEGRFGADPHKASSGSGMRDRSLSPTAPSKEYIYLGDRLLATDEPSIAQAAPPGGVAVAACSASRVHVTWSYDAGVAAAYQVAGFVVERRSGGGNWLRVSNSSNPAQTDFLDTQLTGSTAYFYRVAARNATSEFGFSAEAAAVTGPPNTFTDDPLVPGTAMRARHVAELRQAVDTMRTCAGLGGASWQSDAVAGAIIRAIHVQEMRGRLSEALVRLGVVGPSYTDNSIEAGMFIKAVHVAQLRDALR
jgi:hypothetical protein